MQGQNDTKKAVSVLGMKANKNITQYPILTNTGKYCAVPNTRIVLTIRLCLYFTNDASNNQEGNNIINTNNCNKVKYNDYSVRYVCEHANCMSCCTVLVSEY